MPDYVEVTNTGAGLDKDGYLCNPDPSCAPCPVADHFDRGGGEQTIHNGVDPPCGRNTVYRAFLRFTGVLAANLPPVKAELWLRLYRKASPTAGTSLLLINDFGTLDSGDWNVGVKQNVGTFVSDAEDPDESLPDRWVWKALAPITVLNDTRAVAFQLRYQNEAENPAGVSRWYGWSSSTMAGREPRYRVWRMLQFPAG